MLLDAVSQVTDTYDSSSFTGSTADFGGQAVPFPKGWRAMQLPDTRVDSYFLKTFGRPDRSITCECERTADPSISQVLHGCNGDTINKKLEAKNYEISKLLDSRAAHQKRLSNTRI